MIRATLIILAIVLTSARWSRADVDAELKMFAAATESTYLVADQDGKDQAKPGLELSSKATDAELAKLSKINLKSLKSLNMKSCDKITPDGFASLGVLSSLTNLSFRNQFDDAALAKLAQQVPNLEELSVQGPIAKSSGPTEIGIESLAKCMKLKTITIFSISLTDAVWSSFAKIESLEEIIIAFGDVGEIRGVGIRKLSASKNLRRLTLLTTPFSERGFREIAELQSLTHLIFEETGLKDRDIARLSTLKKLTYLNIENEKLTDAALKSIGAMPAIQYLTLTKVPVTDRGLLNLSDAKSLREVALNLTQVTDKGILQLKKLLPETEVKKSK